MRDFSYLPYYHRTMARQLWLEYEGTLYHVTSGSNAYATLAWIPMKICRHDILVNPDPSPPQAPSV
jgi:hypothetical protein